MDTVRTITNNKPTHNYLDAEIISNEHNLVSDDDPSVPSDSSP